MTIDANSPPPSQSGWPAVVANGLLAAMMLFGLVLLVGAINLIKDGASLWAIAAVATTALFVGGFGTHRFYVVHFRAKVVAAREAATVARYPGQPWMLNPAWARGRIVDAQIGRVIFLWLFCAGWCGGIIAILVLRADAVMASLSSPDKWGNWGFGGFFALLTVMALNVAAKQTRSWLRIGDGVLLLDTLPGWLGGQFKARLQTRLHRLPSAIEIQLTCSRLGHRRDGQSGMVEEQVWSASQELATTKPKRSSTGAIVPVAFELPADLPETGSEAGATDIVWSLRITSNGRSGLRYSWPVPVFRRRG